jgi:TatD DNase family protein
MPVAADTHVHIDAYRQRDHVLDAARDAGVVPVIVSGRASEYRNLVALLAGRGDEVRIGLGLHPEAAGSVYAEHELAVLRDHIEGARWIAEVGLDGIIANSVGSFFGSQPSLGQQQQMLEEILSLGVERKLLSVHSRGAEARTVEILAAANARAASFHWFRGDLAAARQVADAGFHFSVNIDMTRTDEGQALIKWIPEELLLWETDGPFTSVDGRPSEPRDVVPLAEVVAGIRTVATETLLTRTWDNFRRFEARAIA